MERKEALAKWLFDKHTGRIESHENPVSCFNNPKCNDCSETWDMYRREAEEILAFLDKGSS